MATKNILITFLNGKQKNKKQNILKVIVWYFGTFFRGYTAHVYTVNICLSFSVALWWTGIFALW